MNKTKNILGVEVSAVRYSSAIETIFEWLRKSRPHYVCVAAVHLIMECWRNPQLRAGVNRAGLVTPDGMPLVWLMKLRGEKHVERVYGPDLMLKICERAASEKRSVFLLGGAAGQSGKLKAVLQKRFPGLRIAGHQDTPTRPLPEREHQAVIKKINASKADIIFVGLGCPLQEQWMIAAAPQLKKGVAIGVGAAFDFLTGRVKQAPRWMQQVGLEWLFRLIQEPHRLAGRYLFWNTLFIIIIGKHYLLHAFRAMKIKATKTRWPLVLLLALIPVIAWGGWEMARPTNWQFYTEKPIGPNNTLEIHDNLVFNRDLVIFNSQDKNTYALDQRSGTLAWQFTAQNYSPFPATVIDDQVYLAHFDGNIYCLDAQTGRELWRFTLPNFINPDTPILASQDGKTIYFADRASILYALDSSTGHSIWQKQFPAPDITTIFVRNTIHFGSIYGDEKLLYIVNAPSQTVFAVQPETGEIVWQVEDLPFNFSPPLVTPDFVVFLKTDALVIINKHTGLSKRIPRQSQQNQNWSIFSEKNDENVILLIDNQLFSKIDLSTGEKQWSVDHVSAPIKIQTARNLSNTMMMNDMVLVQKFNSFTYQNTVQAINYSDGKVVWSNTLPLGLVTTAFALETSVVLGEPGGHLIALHADTGEQQWRTKLTGEAISAFFEEDIFAVVAWDASQKNNLFGLDPNTGDIIWKYTPDHLTHPQHMYFSSHAAYMFDKEERMVEKIALTRQNPESAAFKPLNFSTIFQTSEQNPFLEYQAKTPFLWKIQRAANHLRYLAAHLPETQQYGLQTAHNDDALEFTIAHNEQLYQNPFTALDITAKLRNQSTGTTTTIKGYYYDHNTWKLRFVPPEDGEYSWHLTVKSAYGFRRWSGTERLTSDALQRLTVRDGEIVKNDAVFFPLGLQHAFIDRNVDGNPINTLDDSAELQPATTPENYHYLSLTDFLDLYKNEADINIFRYGVDNWAPSLYQSLKPGEITWDVNGGKIADTVLGELKKREIHTVMTIFGFYPPFDSKKEFQQREHQKSLALYLDYIIARYGADVDLWEIGNEARSDQEWYRFVIDYLKANDPYQRPISMNWEEPDIAGSDYLSFHWYNEDTSDANLLSDALQFMNLQYGNYNQPMLITELGFTNVSWFPGSDSAVRILSWLATFQKIGVVFWNQGQNGIHQNASNANAYLGPLERESLRSLSQFLPKMTSPVEKDFFALTESGTKVFTLKNTEYSLAYLLKVFPAKSQVVRLTLELDRPGVVEWVEPKTGALLRQEETPAGAVVLTAPDFNVDLALKITYDNAENSLPTPDE